MPKYEFYDVDVIIMLKKKIEELNKQIKMYSDMTTNEFTNAKKEVINKNKKELDKHNNKAVEYYEIILKLKAELEILIYELAEAEKAPKLSAEPARVASTQANNISSEVSKSISSAAAPVSFTGGNRNYYYGKYIKYKAKYLQLKGGNI
jgi:hypothetical protein